MGLVKLILISSLLSMGWQVAASETTAIDMDSVIVSGPIEVHVRYADSPSASFDASLIRVDRQGEHLTFTATQPARLELQLKRLERLDVIEGKLSVKVEGNQRLWLGQVAGQDVCVSLLDRSRFDSDEFNGERLRISITGQGKASLRNVIADAFELDLHDHSDLEVTGETRHQDVDIRGYSHYDGTAFKSTHARIALDDYAAGLIQASNAPLVKGSPFSSLSTHLSKPS